MKTKHLLKRMHKKSLQSKAKCHVVGVGISKRGNVLGIEMSSPVGSRHAPLGHAEWRLMCKYGKALDTIYISRFSKAGNNSCKISACSMCKGLADRLGIKIISLTNEGDNNNEQ